MPNQDPQDGSHLIPLDQAMAMTTRYQKNVTSILQPDLVGQNILCICETFKKDEFLAFLSRDYVYSFRIYYGMSEDMQVHAILVGVDKDGNDILPAGHNGPPGDGDGQIFEDAIRCPTECPPSSCLNTPL
jgi:hypothetical protein